ncbi:Do/DeqQ family serine protease [Pustulibacterium marinum]|uniref:Do/DeqQ family serine protease n=1 Tax=Pustulibacterium marinum TaxID=1224947 RepID=A0A1I7FNJ7_9FLAO|nr:Do family serine endopeptidase [Pustulibacterium marinum]SFU37740.1 Do/DeqQ family serine protease [Pustulibacterium marinum]
MKKFLSMLSVAILGGAITLGSYKLFLEKDYIISEQNTPVNTFTTSFNTPPPAALDEEGFTNAANKTVHAVVHVKNTTIAQSSPNSVFDFFYGNGGTQRAQVGTGSGVIISPDGYIVTNNHVVDNASELEVTLNNNKSYKATLVGTDPNSDIALIKIDADEKLPYLAFGDSDNTQIGEWVLAVGNPFNLTSTVTAGIISAKARDLNPNDDKVQSFIQTDAAVNPGNSGGALVNTAGDLIGINTAITSQTGNYVGYSFAVPSNIAKKIVDDILEYGNVQKGILGITGSGLNSYIAEELGIQNTEGVYVAGVEEESGADKAGLTKGDVIKKIDNIKISKFADLTGYLSSKRPNDKVNVTYERDGDTKTTSVTLLKNNTYVIAGLGLKVKNLSKADQKAFKTDSGVKITDEANYYQNQNLDLKGKVIISINNNPVNSIEDVKSISNDASGYQRNLLIVINQKGEKERYLL